MTRLVFAGALLGGVLLAASAARAGGSVEKGRDMAQKYCSRCHVVGDFNRFGGIGSTPSFQWLINKLPDALERFQTFYTRRPHPAFVRVPGIDPPSENKGYAQKFKVTPENIEDIVAFVKTLRKK